MEDFLRSIIPDISAQNADTIAQPTFGPINVGGGGNSTGASVLLTSDKTTAEVGEIITVQVSIKTNDIPISEYRIAVDFDPLLLRALDENTAVQGTQMNLLDTVFTVTSPEQNNLVTSVGRARLIATAPEDNPQSVNVTVAQIRFQVQSPGSAKISIVQGTTGTQLIRQAGVGLTYTSNELTIQNIASTDNTDQSGNQDGGVTDGGTTVTNPPVVTDGGIITTPDTSISPGFMSLLTLLLAFTSLLVGILLRVTKGKKD